MPTPTVHDPAEGLHLHGHLGLVIRREAPGVVAAWLPGREDIAPDGVVPLGTLGFLCDVVGGHATGLAAQPRWVVTTDVDVRAVGTRRVRGEIQATATVVRAGRTSVVAAIEVHDTGDGSLLAVSTVGSTPLDPDFVPFASTQDDGVAIGHGPEPPAPPPPFREFLGLRPDDGRTTFDMPPLSRNPWGLMHGGAVIEALDVTAASAARSLSGPGAVTTSLHTRLLNGARIGPFEAVAEVLAPPTASGAVTVRVRMVDTGADRLVAIGLAGAGVADGDGGVTGAGGGTVIDG